MHAGTSRDRRGKNGTRDVDDACSRPLAATADRYALYQAAVQTPQSEIRFFDRVFREAYGRSPRVLREDFCGTGAVCCAWVESRRDRHALGVDLDPEPLAWGTRNNVALLGPDAQRRVQFQQTDVRQVSAEKADVISAENFSYFIFPTRDELRGYLRTAWENLETEGVLVLDIMGGPEVQQEGTQDVRRVDGFRYVWDLARFDPITNSCTYFIHFKFKDGSEIKRAFRYDWRLWTVPEVRELLGEVGFRRIDVYWEGADDDGHGNGVFRRRQHAPCEQAWIAYVVGIK